MLFVIVPGCDFDSEFLASARINKIWSLSATSGKNVCPAVLRVEPFKKIVSYSAFELFLCCIHTSLPRAVLKGFFNIDPAPAAIVCFFTYLTHDVFERAARLLLRACSEVRDRHANRLGFTRTHDDRMADFVATHSRLRPQR